MNPVLQSWAQVLTIAVVLVGALMYQAHYVDKRLEGLENSLNKRIDDLRSEMESRFDELIRYIDQRFRNVEGRLDRLESPVQRP